MNLETFEIDSFTLKIAVEKVKNTSGILQSQVETTTTDLHTGLVIEELTNFKTINTYYSENEEIPTTYEVRNYYNNTKDIKQVEQYYLIKITSKHLRNRYFEGLTKDNIKQVYQSIIDQNIIFVDYQDFLQSVCIDVDFKKDHYNKYYSDVLDKIKLATIPTKEIGTGIKTFNKKYNQGFQFGSRKYATETKPYIKYYNKELQTKVSEKNKGMKGFFETYLTEYQEQVKHLYRIEYTIKGKRMFQKYGLSGNNKLIELLNIPNEVKTGISKDILSKHTERIIKPIRINTKLTAKQKTALMIKDLSVKLGLSMNEIEAYIKGYNLRYETEKALLKDISEIDFDNQDQVLNNQLEINNTIQKLLSEIGLN